ncbi:MAG TPA: SRPBCC domain-containing protein [Flavisolibacter sp.]|jgi:uncharacterized protein YndB with AHSA1/START domain|nr:SRPBCC domain-containing protein [Flavisolibacter sp.]
MKQQETILPVRKEVLLPASVERVWQALTTKEELKQWCFEMNAFEPKPGFEFRFYGEKNGTRFLHLCRVLEIEPLKRMKWLWSYEGIPGDTYVTFELMPEGAQTRLRLTHEGLETLPQDENYARGNFEMGWDSILNISLKSYIS